MKIRGIIIHYSSFFDLPGTRKFEIPSTLIILWDATAFDRVRDRS